MTSPTESPAVQFSLVRCAATTRTPRGWEMCHRDEHPADMRHHVRDRSWSSGGKTPRLQLGQPCGPGCRWPDEVTPYFGTAPQRGTGAGIGGPPRTTTRRRDAAQTGG